MRKKAGKLVQIKAANHGTECREIPGFPGYAVGNDGSVWSQWQQHGNGRYASSPRFYTRGEWKKMHPSCEKNKKHAHLGVSVGLGISRRRINVHSLVLLAFVGPRPSGMECLHGDGNSRNNNLWNLKWGTPEENNQDKLRHGTVRHGENHPHCKISESAAAEIRRRYSAGESQKSLAREFGVSRTEISGIATMRLWRRIGGSPVPYDSDKRSSCSRAAAAKWSKLSKEDIRDIRKRRSEGEFLSSIGERYGIGKSHVARIAKGLSWSTVA